MTREMGVSIARTPSPETLPGDVVFVEGALNDVGHAMGRFMDPFPVTGDLLDPECVASNERIAEILSRVKDDSPKIDPTTEQGIAEATANMIGRAEAVIEQATDPVVKREIKKFQKTKTRGVASFLTKPFDSGRRKFVRAFTLAGLTLIISACAPKIISSAIIPRDGGGATSPNVTESAPVMIPTETTVPTPTEAPTPTQEVADTKQLEAQWVSEGYVEDLRYGGTYSLKEHEVGKEKREFIVYRVGFTEIWFDKGFATSLKDQILLPNTNLPDSQDHIQSWGALVHALNIGRVVSENQYNYDPDWFPKFLKDMAAHPGEKYVLKAWRKVPNGNEMYEMGKVDPSKPVRIFLLPPTLSADTALHTPGGKDAPWQLSFNYWQGFMDAKISSKGSLDIYYSNCQYTPTQILESFQAKDSDVSEDFLASIAYGPVDFGSFSTFRSDRTSSPISTIPNYYRAMLSDFIRGGVKAYRFDRNLSFVTLSPTPTQ